MDGIYRAQNSFRSRKNTVLILPPFVKVRLTTPSDLCWSSCSTVTKWRLRTGLERTVVAYETLLWKLAEDTEEKHEKPLRLPTGLLSNNNAELLRWHYHSARHVFLSILHFVICSYHNLWGRTNCIVFGEIRLQAKSPSNSDSIPWRSKRFFFPRKHPVLL